MHTATSHVQEYSTVALLSQPDELRIRWKPSYFEPEIASVSSTPKLNA